MGAATTTITTLVAVDTTVPSTTVWLALLARFLLGLLLPVAMLPRQTAARKR